MHDPVFLASFTLRTLQQQYMETDVENKLKVDLGV